MEIRKPIIGVPVNVLVERNGAFPGTQRAFVNQDYLMAVKLAGGVPIALPFVSMREDIRAQLSLLDGLLFPGGGDLSPLTYGEEPDRGLGDVDPEMDDHQLALTQVARELDLPMLGICRGMQLLNVAFGGTLYQDLDGLPEPLHQHVQKSQRHAISHSVALEEGSRLHGIFGGRPSVGTNSFHHQAVKDLAPCFRVNARTRDGVIEGFEGMDGAFILGVQWHPEGMVEKHPPMLGIFQALVEASHRRGAGAA